MMHIKRCHPVTDPCAKRVTPAPMSRWIIALLLTCASAAQAAPATASPEEIERIERFLTDKGLLLQLDDVRHSVADKAHVVADRTADLIGNAMGFIGVPYRRGGTSASTGFDCSGFVRAVYEKTVGMVLPRKAAQQAASTQVIDKKELQPGDLVFFNTMRRAFSHVGIYVGDGKFIHSPRTGSEVRVEDMRQSYWQRRFDGARRVTVEAKAQP